MGVLKATMSSPKASFRHADKMRHSDGKPRGRCMAFMGSSVSRLPSSWEPNPLLWQIGRPNNRLSRTPLSARKGEDHLAERGDSGGETYLICLSHDKFLIVVLKCLRNIYGTLEHPPEIYRAELHLLYFSSPEGRRRRRCLA